MIACAIGGAGRDELEPGVAYAPPAGFAAADDGFVAFQLGDGGEDGAPVAVEQRDDAPHGELLPGEASVDQLFGHRGGKRTARRPLVWLRLARRDCMLRPNGRSVHGGCGGPVLDAAVAHLGFFVEVVVRRLWVVGRRRGRSRFNNGWRSCLLP